MRDLLEVDALDGEIDAVDGDDSVVIDLGQLLADQDVRAFHGESTR